MTQPPYAAAETLSDIRGAADLIEKVSETVTILGFCKPGTVDETSETWSLMKIEQIGQLTSFKWANGICSYNLQWSERHTYDYLFKNF